MNCEVSNVQKHFTCSKYSLPASLGPHKQLYCGCSAPVSEQTHTKHRRINMMHELAVPSLQLAALGTVHYIEHRNSYRQNRPTPGPADMAVLSHTVSLRRY